MHQCAKNETLIRLGEDKINKLHKVMSADSKCYMKNKVRKGNMDCGQEGLQGNILKVKEMSKKVMQSAREKCPTRGNQVERP